MFNDRRFFMEENVREFLRHIGEDSTRDGLKDTPKRVVESWKELFSGYNFDLKTLKVTFAECHDELIVARDIEFFSFCEHHLLPFFGRAHVGYIPKGDRILGLSKIPRLVEAVSKKLQNQERLTDEIIDKLNYVLGEQALGAGAVLEASHMCVACRGVKQRSVKMITSSLRGVLRTKPEARAEFFALIGK